MASNSMTRYNCLILTDENYSFLEYSIITDLLSKANNIAGGNVYKIYTNNKGVSNDCKITINDPSFYKDLTYEIIFDLSGDFNDYSNNIFEGTIIFSKKENEYPCRNILYKNYPHLISEISYIVSNNVNDNYIKYIFDDIAVTDLFFQKEQKKKDSTISHITDIMFENIEEPLCISHICKEIEISRRTLERLFKDKLQDSPSNYYINIRLNEAKYLIVKTSLAVKEVAIRTGFKCSSHFSKCYKKYFGISPLDERERVKDMMNKGHIFYDY